MLTGFMIARPSSLLAVLATPPFGPDFGVREGAVDGAYRVDDTLTASTNALPVNATTDIIAPGARSRGNAAPQRDGGHLYDDARDDPTGRGADQRRRARGRQVRRGSANGSAVITATSGGATTGTDGAIKIAVGTAAVGRVSVNASPAMVPANGGSTTVVASVFESTATHCGRRRSRSRPRLERCRRRRQTDANGVASTTLTTSQQATVTASVGAQAPPAGTGTGTGTGPARACGDQLGSGIRNGGCECRVRAVAGDHAAVVTASVGLPANFTFAVTGRAERQRRARAASELG